MNQAIYSLRNQLQDSWTRFLFFDESVSSSARLLLFFRQFLVLKIGIPFAFPNGYGGAVDFQGGMTTLLVLFLMVLACLPLGYIPGLVGIWLLSSYDMVSHWPFTINHNFLECMILSLLILNPSDKPDTVTNLIKVIMLSVWVYSGIHKLWDGYFLNGEFFAFEVLSSQPEPLGERLNHLLSLIGSWISDTTEITPVDCCVSQDISIPTWGIFSLLFISWMTIATEIGLPLLVYFKKTRPLGIASLFIFQGFIAYFSGEIDFAFTAFAILMLFIPPISAWAYPLLALTYMVVMPWM